MPVRRTLKLLTRRRAWDEWDNSREPELEAATPRSRKRRAAATLTFATLFFAGAALSAGAGNQVQALLTADDATSGSASSAAAQSVGTTTEATPPAESPPASAPAPDPTAPPAASGQRDDGSDASSTSPPADPATQAPAADSSQAPASTDSSVPAGGADAPSEHVAPAFRRAVTSARKGRGGRVVARTGGRAGRSARAAKLAKRGAPVHARPVELEGAAASGATIWLNSARPDPTPPALRLAPRFAGELRATAREDGVDWALVLGVLRAEGDLGSAPGGFVGLRRVAANLASRGARANLWGAAFSVAGQTALADRAVALSHYYRAVGLDALVTGLLAQQKALGQRVLNDPRVSIYAGGRGDIEANRVNVRVLAMIEYVADSFGQVTVSCLVSGHRLYARPGVVSAHIYGLAADLSSVGGTTILGHQQPGGITERAVREMLLLPPEMMPRQIISLLGLGGPSFPLDDHYNHIHVGF